MVYEDFLTYTEVDAGDDITVTANYITVADMIRNVTSYVKKDYGSNQFGDFEHKYTATLILTDNQASGIIWMLSANNATNTYQNALDNNESMGVWFQKWEGVMELKFRN